MEHWIFNLDDLAFEDSTRQFRIPDRIMPLLEEEGVDIRIPHRIMPVQEEEGVDIQLFQRPADDVGIRLSQRPAGADTQLSQRPARATQVSQRYASTDTRFFQRPIGVDTQLSQRPTGTDIQLSQRPASADTQLFQRPTGLPAPQELRDRTSDTPENPLVLDPLDAFWIQEYGHYSYLSRSDCDVPEDELTDEMEDISSDEDQLVEHFTEGDHDQSTPVIIGPVEDMCSEEDPVNLQEEEDPTGQGDHDQPSPVEDSETPGLSSTNSSPMNLHVTVGNVQEIEHEEPSAPRRLDFNNATLVSVYSEEDQEVIPEMMCPRSDCDVPEDNISTYADQLVPGHLRGMQEQEMTPLMGRLDMYPTMVEELVQDEDTNSPSHSVNLVTLVPDGAFKFTMADLNTITGNFSESRKIEQGGPGSVYRGQLKDGTTVDVRRIKKNDENVLEVEDAKDFQTEADTLFNETHVNLVRLLGFLEDEDELILVTEYVTNGNLRQHLDGVPYGVILDMSKRCRISLDIVAALKHLHNQTKDDLDIIHRDIKSSDILITDDFHAKVASFGLFQCSPFGDVDASSSSTQMKGISGSMTHEHSIAHHLKKQNDVYLFGELLVEIFTGIRLGESSLPSDECLTPRWVLKQCAEGRLMDIIDPKITPTSFDLKILEEIFKLAASCLVCEESNRPTIEDVLEDLSSIVGRHFGDLKDESMSKGDKYEAQKDRNWDLEACIEPSLQTLCLEESEVLKGQEPTQHMDSPNPSIMSTRPHASLLFEGFESSKVQTSTQLGIQLDMDSKQATRQASEVLITSQDQTSPLFVGIIRDMLELKSDETYFEMLQEEIAKLSYISRLLSQGDDFELNLTNIGKTSFFLYFNEKDNVFEFYFKNYHGMASVVGVGLESAKVVLEDGWRVTIQEILKPDWDDAWRNFDSSSTMKVTIPESLEEGMDNMEDSQEALASIPRGQCLLLDLAQYFILKMAIASFLLGDSMTHANNDNASSSSPSSQDIARSSSSGDQKPSKFFQVVKNILFSRETSDQLKIKNVDGTPLDPPGDNDVKIDTTVHLKLLPGGDLFDGNNPLDATISDDKELEELTSQLDKTIYLEMMFKFLNKDDRKKIQVLVGPISFLFRVKNEDNYKKFGQFGWYHKSLDVSFGPVNTCDSDIGANHNAVDIVKVKKTITIESSDATTRGTSNSMNGGIQGKIPHFVTLHGGGSSGQSTTKSTSDNVGLAIEKEIEETRNGFAISSERNLLSSTLEYTYCAPDYMHELDHGKLPSEVYRKDKLSLLPICRPQVVKFEGTWLPKSSENNPQEVAEYFLHTSREVHMTSKEVSKKVLKKPWIKMMCGHSKIQKESNEPLKYIQKYIRSIFLNHAMTHLNGKEFEVEEILSQQPLNQREPETHLEVSRSHAPQWQANPLVGLNSDLHYQP